MLIALAGYLTGYDGEFEFKEPGDKYGDTHYVGMRVVCQSFEYVHIILTEHFQFCALMGSMCVPLVFLITQQVTPSLTAAALAATIVLTGMSTDSHSSI